MPLKNVVQDNFFEDPDSVRAMALDLHLTYNYQLDSSSELGAWRGMRTLNLHTINGPYYRACKELSKQILDFVWKAQDLDNYEYPEEETSLKGQPLKEKYIAPFFHVLPDQGKLNVPNYELNKYHRDDVPCAGVVYLSPDPPPNTGTAVLDPIGNKIDIIDNKYNRLVCYDGYQIHAPQDTFGVDLETGRMTFTFFIHELSVTGEV